ncbi:hypothetical protein [Solilutibacter silvestris]|uniref:hypothetical protein n=1 Tax=Solilutibacter silvestris TaxID=1645665 RepID=UPI003D326567
MKVRPIQWQGSKRTETLSKLLATKLENWLLAWSVDAQLMASVQAESQDPGHAGIAWRMFTRGDQAIWVSARGDLDKRLGLLLTGVRSGDSAGIAGNIGARAIQDLVASLSESTGDWVVETLHASPDSKDIDARFGASRFAIDLGPEQFAVILNSALANTLLPRERVRKESTLVARKAAVGKTTVSLKVVMEMGEIPIRSGLEFRAGEVFKSGRELDQPIRLQAIDGRVIQEGRLAMHEGQRALQLN